MVFVVVSLFSFGSALLSLAFATYLKILFMPHAAYAYFDASVHKAMLFDFHCLHLKQSVNNPTFGY